MPNSDCDSQNRDNGPNNVSTTREPRVKAPAAPLSEASQNHSNETTSSSGIPFESSLVDASGNELREPDIGVKIISTVNIPSKMSVAEDFDLHSKLPRAGKSSDHEARIGEWHQRLIGHAEGFLSRCGVEFDRLIAPEGHITLLILPVLGKSQLNEFAYKWGERLDGLSFVYSPRDLIRRGSRSDPQKIRKARSLYQREKHVVLLPDRAIVTGLVDDAIHHEVLHAEFNFLLRHGIGSLFHGWFKSAREGTPMWASSKYPFRMSLEELATHSLNLKYIAEELATSMREEEGEARDRRVSSVLNKLVRKALTLNALASHSEQTIHAILESFDSLAVRFFQEDLGHVPGELRPPAWVVWVEFSFRAMQVKLPLMSPADRIAFALLKGPRREIALKELRNSLRRRLTALGTLAGQLSASSRILIGGANEVCQTPRPQVENLLELTVVPRKLTEDFIHWGN